MNTQITTKIDKRLSKFLSLILRHKPQTVGITLDPQGWANIDELIDKMNAKNKCISREVLYRIVREDNKKRYSFNENQSKIRANQGHSVSVDLGLVAQIPPSFLYHGTSEKNVKSILASGLEKRNRHHIHLSMDEDTAMTVGSRHGKPVILTVDASQMVKDGYEFYCSENNVWLIDHVPVTYLRQMI